VAFRRPTGGAPSPPGQTTLIWQTQLDATTLLLPGQTAEVHRFGSLVVHDQ
jgi:hypothetical protein